MPCAESNTRAQAYFDGELDAVTAADVEQHIERCTECRVLLTDLEQMRIALRRDVTYERTPSALRARIVRALDGPLAPIACASVTAYRPCDDCGDLKSCPVRLIMVAARDAIAGVLDLRTLADMRALSPGEELALMYDI